MAYQKRLKKEYEELSMRAPTGICLDQETTEDNIDVWASNCAVYSSSTNPQEYSTGLLLFKDDRDG